MLGFFPVTIPVFYRAHYFGEKKKEGEMSACAVGGFFLTLNFHLSGIGADDLKSE